MSWNILHFVGSDAPQPWAVFRQGFDTKAAAEKNLRTMIREWGEDRSRFAVVEEGKTKPPNKVVVRRLDGLLKKLDADMAKMRKARTVLDEKIRINRERAARLTRERDQAR